jgi:hypothetical protein
MATHGEDVQVKFGASIEKKVAQIEAGKPAAAEIAPAK